MCVNFKIITLKKRSMNDLSLIIKEQISKCGSKREALMPVLQELVRQKNYITTTEVLAIARELDLSAADIYGTASFYTFLDTKKRGKNVIRVCKSIIAVMKGKDEIVKTLEEVLNIKIGQTTEDGMFTLLETNDIGWSDAEPSMLINERVYTNLTPSKVTEIINTYIQQ